MYMSRLLSAFTVFSRTFEPLASRFHLIDVGRLPILVEVIIHVLVPETYLPPCSIVLVMVMP